MISLLVKSLRPLFVPLLKLRMDAPHLPEGSTLVRQLKPAPAWLTLKYIHVFLGMVGNLVVGVGVSIAALTQWGTEGIFIALAIWLALFAILGFALVATRLDFELRDYLVGDKSLRVRMGAMNQREVTLSYANVQNIEVRQGPLERIWGFKSLTVSTAGGGTPMHEGERSTHEVTLEGLTQADEIRALVMSMLKKHTDTGLAGPTAKPTAALPIDALREVLQAAQLLEAAARNTRHRP